MPHPARALALALALCGAFGHPAGAGQILLRAEPPYPPPVLLEQATVVWVYFGVSSQWKVQPVGWAARATPPPSLKGWHRFERLPSPNPWEYRLELDALVGPLLACPDDDPRLGLQNAFDLRLHPDVARQPRGARAANWRYGRIGGTKHFPFRWRHLYLSLRAETEVGWLVDHSPAAWPDVLGSHQRFAVAVLDASDFSEDRDDVDSRPPDLRLHPGAQYPVAWPPVMPHAVARAAEQALTFLHDEPVDRVQVLVRREVSWTDRRDAGWVAVDDPLISTRHNDLAFLTHLLDWIQRRPLDILHDIDLTQPEPTDPNPPLGTAWLRDLPCLSLSPLCP